MKKMKHFKFVLLFLTLFISSVLFIIGEKRVKAYVAEDKTMPDVAIEKIELSANHQIIGYGDRINMRVYLKCSDPSFDISKLHVMIKGYVPAQNDSVKRTLLNTKYNQEIKCFEGNSVALNEKHLETKYTYNRIEISYNDLNKRIYIKDFWFIFNDNCKHGKHTESDKWDTIKLPTLKSTGEQQLLCKYCDTVLKTKSIPKIKLVKTKKIAFTRKSLSLKKNKTYQLKIKRTPSKANDKITYKSSKPKIVKVYNNGKVKALKKGTAVITVRAASGKKATIKITIK